MAILVSMGSSVFATWYVIAIEHPVDREWHMHILIHISQVALYIVHLIQLAQRTIKDALAFSQYFTIDRIIHLMRGLHKRRSWLYGQITTPTTELLIIHDIVLLVIIC